MRVRILERGAKTIREAYTIEAKYEAYVASALTPGPVLSEETNHKRARAIGASKPSPSERRIAALEKTMQSMADGMKQMQLSLQSIAQPVNS